MTATTIDTAHADPVCLAATAHARSLAATAGQHAVTPAVAAAVVNLDTKVAGDVTFWPDGTGGAHVFIDHVDLGAPYAQASTWVAFHIANSTPHCDVYPHWVRSDLARVDGTALTPPMHAGNNWLGLGATMISLRSNNRDPQIDSPALKLARVLSKIRSL